MATVLIVEDEAPILILAESILQSNGHDTISAGTLAEAQAIIESDKHIDLLFTDLSLGTDIDGGFLLGQLASEKRNIPIVYTSGRTMTDGMTELLAEQSAFLAKPYTDEQMISAVAQALRTGKKL